LMNYKFAFLVAFANADGGSLVIGVEDNGEITGFNNSKAHKIDEFKDEVIVNEKKLIYQKYIYIIVS